MKTTLFLSTVITLIGLIFSANTTGIKGKVTDTSIGEPVLFGTVVLYQNGVVLTGTETDLEDILSMYPIDIRILGEEYRDKDFTGKDICRKRDIDLYFNKRDHRFSSSDLRRRVCE